MSATTGSLVSRIYKGFRGVDFRSDEANFSRSPDCLNVWKDYKEIDSIRTRPGLELVCAFDEPVYNISYYGGFLYVHSGRNLYRVLNGEKTLLYDMMDDGPSVSFVFNDVWYIKCFGNYLMLKKGTIEEVAGYVPTTSIGRKPSGGGTPHEDVNILTNKRINTFVADGESMTYYLDAKNIDSSYDLKVFVNGVLADHEFTVNYEEGSITFSTSFGAPPAPLTDGQDNVSVEFGVFSSSSDNLYSFMYCKYAQVFDNRVFFAGYDGRTIWHSSLNDPTYVCDLDYYQDGTSGASIRSMVAGNNALWVFSDYALSDTTVFYHTPVIDSQYGKVYPSVHSSITAGCVGRAINFNDDIVFFSDRGMEGISGDITTEQALAHRSSLVDRKLTACLNTSDWRDKWKYKDMVLIEWEGYLFVFIDDKAYLADSRSKFTNGDHIEYEWFYWELGKTVYSAFVDDGVLYLGTDDGVYTLTDMDAHMESYWTTPKDRFGAAHKLKTTNKRGCVAEATGDVTVYAKVEDTDFEKIGDYKDVQDYFVSRIKRKKFKDLQLKFHSNTRFSLESATLEAWVGGYIKR